MGEIYDKNMYSDTIKYINKSKMVSWKIDDFNKNCTSANITDADMMALMAMSQKRIAAANLRDRDICRDFLEDAIEEMRGEIGA